ncbi:type II toxin-antitoxin system RelE family toxin [Actinotignum sp. GS-2025a]
MGNYRVIYEIEDDKLLVTVLRAAHRREVYA